MGSAVPSIDPTTPPDVDSHHVWGRQRIIFLIASALFVVAAIWFTREVVLPFILAMIIAYVLTPLVAWCERRGMPREIGRASCRERV